MDVCIRDRELGFFILEIAPVITSSGPSEGVLYTTKPGPTMGIATTGGVSFHKPTEVTAGQTVTITSYHNHMNIWFEAFEQNCVILI